MARNSEEPPVFYGKMAQKSIKAENPNTIQIYNSYGFSDDLLNEFLAIFDQNQRIYIDEKDLFNYVALYESFCVFAKLTEKYLHSLKEKPEDGKIRIDGKALWNMAVGMTFQGKNLAKVEANILFQECWTM